MKRFIGFISVRMVKVRKNSPYLSLLYRNKIKHTYLCGILCPCVFLTRFLAIFVLRHDCFLLLLLKIQSPLQRFNSRVIKFNHQLLCVKAAFKNCTTYTVSNGKLHCFVSGKEKKNEGYNRRNMTAFCPISSTGLTRMCMFYDYETNRNLFFKVNIIHLIRFDPHQQ